MSTIEIILAVAIFLVLLGTWDNSGRIDQLQRWRAAQDNKARASIVEAKERDGKNPMAKNLLGIIDNLETTIKMQNSQIKDLNGELEKKKTKTYVNFPGECPECIGKGKYRKPYTDKVTTCESCNGSGKETPSLNELRLLTFGCIGTHRVEIRSKIKALGAKSTTTLDPIKYKELRDFMPTSQVEKPN